MSPATSSLVNVDAISFFGSWPSSRTSAIGQMVQAAQQRTEHPRDDGEDRPERDGDPVGTGDGDVLRHHLAERNVGGHHEQQRDGERHRVKPGLGDAEVSNSGSSSAATAGSPSVPSSTAQTVMPSCAQAIISETSSIARSVARARGL